MTNGRIAPELMGLIYANRAGYRGPLDIQGRIRSLEIDQAPHDQIEYWRRALISCQRTLASRKHAR